MPAFSAVAAAAAAVASKGAHGDRVVHRPNSDRDIEAAIRVESTFLFFPGGISVNDRLSVGCLFCLASILLKTPSWSSEYSHLRLFRFPNDQLTLECVKWPLTSMKGALNLASCSAHVPFS